jgi:hypothetical protein
MIQFYFIFQKNLLIENSLGTLIIVFLKQASQQRIMKEPRQEISRCYDTRRIRIRLFIQTHNKCIFWADPLLPQDVYKSEAITFNPTAKNIQSHLTVQQ